MNNAGEFIGKTVLSLSGERLGEINNLAFDKYFKRLKNLCVFNDEQEEFMLPINSIYKHGENAVLTRVNLKDAAQFTYISPLTVKAYNLNGKYLGVVIDMFFEDDSKTVKSLLLDDGNEISQKNVASHGKDAVIFDFSQSPKRFMGANKPKSNFALQLSLDLDELETSNTQEVLQQENLEDLEKINEQTIDTPIETNDDFKRPDNLVVGAKLLIGRKLKKDIFLRDGKLLIKSGTIITLDTVNLALSRGKLFELTVNSLSNLN